MIARGYRLAQLPGINFYSGFRTNGHGGGGGADRNPKKNQVSTFIVASGKMIDGGGGVQIEILRLL